MALPQANIKSPYWNSVAKTSNYSIQGTDIRTVFHNLNAAGNIVLSLPKAGNSSYPRAGGPGLEYQFLVAQAHTITVTPVTGDTLRGKATSASATNATVGSFLHIKCVIPGYWEILLNIGGW